MRGSHAVAMTVFASVAFGCGTTFNAAESNAQVIGTISVLAQRGILGRSIIRPGPTYRPSRRESSGSRSSRSMVRQNVPRSSRETRRTRGQPQVTTRVVRPDVVDRRIDRLERRRGGPHPTVIVMPSQPRPVPQTTIIVRQPVVRVVPQPIVAFRAPIVRLPVGGVALAPIAARPPAPVVVRQAVSAGTRRDAVWDHNSSVMRLTLEPEQIRYTYEVPRTGLASLGIDRGTLLFEGRNVGGVRYEGTAYTFSRQCGAARFAVAGEASPDGSRLELKGDRPIRNERCDVTRHEEETLVFDLASNRGSRTDVPAPLLPIEQAVMSGDVPAGVMAGDEHLRQPAPVGQLADPVWTYNGSPLRVEVDNLNVRFYQEMARAGAEAEQSGTKPRPLFEGRNIADTTYAGSAFAYTTQCGEVPFRVQGKVSPDGVRLELTGQKPELDDKCGVTGHRAENLVFELR